MCKRLPLVLNSSLPPKKNLALPKVYNVKFFLLWWNIFKTRAVLVSPNPLPDFYRQKHMSGKKLKNQGGFMEKEV